MAKLTIEEAKVKLVDVAKAIEFFKASGMEVLPLVQAEFDRLTKIITGKSSNNTAAWFNDNIATQLNGNPEIVSAIETACGVKSRLTVTIVTDEAGKKSVVFEGGSAGSSGGQKAGTTSGGMKASTPFNHWSITVNDTPETAGYKEKAFECGTASKMLEFILNGGKNPMNLGADWQAGNSAKRALVGEDNVSGLLKNEVFTKHFTLVGSNVAKTAEPAVTEATSDEPKA